jgi:uncharacterized membrane protein
MSRPIAALIAAGVISAAPPAFAKPYKFHTLDFKATDNTILQGINKSGMIIGNYVTPKGNESCFTSNGKSKTPLSNPDEKFTICGGINAKGDIVGYYPAKTALGAKPFLYSNGIFTTLKPPGATGGAIAYGINDAGTIIGTYVDAAGAQHGFLLTGKTYTSFDAPGEVITLGVSINNSGQFTVQSADSNGKEHSFINSGGTYTELVFPNAAGPTRVHQINDKGIAALGWTDSLGNDDGGLYESASATYVTVNVPNAALTGIEGINDSDTLVGIFATPTDSVYEGFIATGKP